MVCDPNKKDFPTCECGCRMSGMMKTCMKRGRWVPIAPIIVGLTLFLLGYFLSPEVVRILWLILSSLIILMGVAGLIMATMMMRNNPEERK